MLMIPTTTSAIRISIRAAAVTPKPMISPNHVAISPAAFRSIHRIGDHCPVVGIDLLVDIFSITVSENVFFNIFRYFRRISQCLDDILFILRSRIIKIFIIIL